MRKFLCAAAVLSSFGLALAAVDAGGDAQKKGKNRFRNDPEAAFKKLDANSDGKLSKDELMKVADKQIELANRMKENLGKAYDKAAAGSDGLTLDQYKELRAQRGQRKRPAAADAPKTTEEKKTTEVK